MIFLSVLQKEIYQEVFCKKCILKISKISQENTCVDRVAGHQPAASLKGDSNTYVLLWNLQNFLEYLFYRTPSVAACDNFIH